MRWPSYAAAQLTCWACLADCCTCSTHAIYALPCSCQANDSRTASSPTSTFQPRLQTVSLCHSARQLRVEVVQTLIRSLLRRNPTHRPSARALLKHPWICSPQSHGRHPSLDLTAHGVLLCISGPTQGTPRAV